MLERAVLTRRRKNRERAWFFVPVFDTSKKSERFFSSDIFHAGKNGALGAKHSPLASKSWLLVLKNFRTIAMGGILC